MANVGPTKWYCDSVGWTAVAGWTTGVVTAAGKLIRQTTTPTVGNERVFVCIVAGTTAAAEPAWTVTKGATTAEAGGPTWQECTGQPGVNGDTTNSPTWLQNKNTAVTAGLVTFDSVTLSLQIVSTGGTTGNGAQPSFSATAGTTTADNTVTWTSLGLASNFNTWKAPAARIGIISGQFGAGWSAAGDTFYIASEHAETQASANTPGLLGSTAAPNLLISVNKAGNVPPQAADYLAGASMASTGGNDCGFGNGGSAYFIGLTISAGANVQCNGVTNSFQYYKNCKFLVSTGGGAHSLQVHKNALVVTKFDNTTVKFGSTGDNIIGGNNSTVFEWLNTPSAIDGTGSIPTTLFSWAGTNGPSYSFFHGVDLSAITGTLFAGLGNNSSFQTVLSNSRINATVTLFSAFNPPANSGAGALTLVNVDSGATGYRNEWHNYFGDITPETTITLKNGASDGVQSIAHKYISSANVTPIFPLVWPPLEKKFGVWNTTTGKSVTATVQIISSQTLNNNDVWLEIEYLGSAASPLSSFANNGLANPLSTVAAQTTSTATWNSQPPTPVAQQLQVSFTPQMVGYVYGRIMVGKASTTLYVDPELIVK